jgi:calcineurin-like phosphoesterase family protein
MIKFGDILTTGRVWITSDTHYNHKNICRGVTNWRTPEGKIPIGSTRDFQTLGEMNDKIINNINEKVGQNDTLIHLGDVSFGGFDKIGEFLDRLVCKNVHLVMGNHDQHIKSNREDIRDRFISVQEYREVKIDGENFVLSHYPFASWHGLNKGVIHLHGHVHLSPKNKWGNGKKLDVGMDGNNLYPYSITEIVHMMDKRDVGSDVTNDHHLDAMLGVVG